MELTVRPAESNTLLASPHVGGIVRVGGLHIRPGGGLREVHLGATSLSVQRRRQLAASSALLLLLVSELRNQALVLSLRDGSIREVLNTLKLQILTAHKNTAVLRRQTHNRGDEGPVLLGEVVVVVAPRLNDVLLRRIQGVCGELDGAVKSASLQAGYAIGAFIVGLHIAHRQDGGAGALLTNHVHGTLTTGQLLTNETLTLNQQLLILRGILQGIILPLRCHDFRMVSAGVHRVVSDNVLASPNILNARLGLTLSLGQNTRLVTHLVQGDTREIIDGSVEIFQSISLDGQLCLKSAIIGNGEILTLFKTEHRRGRLSVTGAVLRSSNVEDNGAVLLTPLLGETGTLQGHGATLAGVQNTVIISGVRRLCRCILSSRLGGHSICHRCISNRCRILGECRSHRQNHSSSQHQCAATLRRTEERRLRVRKRGHTSSLRVVPIGMMRFHRVSGVRNLR